MTDFDDEVFALPVSGHYDCGYSYGSTEDKLQTSQLSKPASPVKNLSPVYLANRPGHLPFTRPRSPPTVLPNAFTAPRSQITTPTSALTSPTNSAFTTTYNQVETPPLLPPRPWTVTKPTSPTNITYSSQHNSDSDLSTLSSRSRQASTQSAETTGSSFSSASLDRPIEPDPLPSHSHPQWLSPTQSAAFSGPRPIQPMRLGRRRICDSYSGDVLYQLSDETKLKLSKQAVYQVYEPDSSSTVGTIAYPQDSQDEVAAILRGKDVVMKKESSSSHRWSFKPSILTKKGASWYWSKDKLRGDIVLADAKKGGMIVARIQRDVLSFERAGLGLDTVNEICFSAMALAEMARRSSLYEDAPNLAAAIAIVALGEAAEDRNSDDTIEGITKPKRKLTLTLR